MPRLFNPQNTGVILLKNYFNLTMLTDFYEITMSNGYFEAAH